MNYTDEIKEIINTRFGSISQNRKRILDYFRELSQYKKICLFGAGRAGKAVYLALRDQNIRVDMFCDNDKNKWEAAIIDDKICISYEELEKCKDDAVCIISTGADYSEEINSQLVKSGFQYIYGREIFISQLVSFEADSYNVNLVREKILQVVNMLSDEHSLKVLYYKLKSLTADLKEWKSFSFHDILDRDIYFIKGGRYLKGKSTIVDCGAYDGDTMMYLVDTLKYVDFERYIAYEMDFDNFSKLHNRIGKLPDYLSHKITAYGLGVGKKSCRIRYSGDLSECYVSANGDRTAEIVPIDEHLYGMDIDFIKMDIEGSEMDALIGAEKTIERCRPMCAISIYHKFSDLWEIPLFFNKAMPEAKFILRHHNNCYYDTVFYAIPEERIKE